MTFSYLSINDLFILNGDDPFLLVDDVFFILSGQDFFLLVDDVCRGCLPCEEVLDLITVQTRLVEVGKLPRHPGVRELCELPPELLHGELVFQG